MQSQRTIQSTQEAESENDFARCGSYANCLLGADKAYKHLAKALTIMSTIG